tara:strand:- start:494 stop:790 length:297 start_codon:yes stop_codon:yes gene_type:complete
MILANILESPVLTGAIAGGLGTLAFFVYCFAKKIQIGRGRKMGLNFDQTCCPNCGRELPRIRRPANFRQMLWGGWTFPSCGEVYDKWMNTVSKEKSDA